MLEKIKKRNNQIVEFDSLKITSAILASGKITAEFGEREARKLTLRVLTLIHELRLGPVAGVEEIQDIVERVLLDSPYYKSAKSLFYIASSLTRLEILPLKPILTLWINI